MNHTSVKKSSEHTQIELPTIGPKRRTAIGTSKIEYVSLNANPILGCSHGCRYCYARKIDVKYERVKSNLEWANPEFFTNYFEVLKREIETGKIPKDKEIFLSTMTDIYQPYAIKYGIGRKLIQILQNAGLSYRILTKSPRIVEDKDILSYEKGKVGLSITTDSNNHKMQKYWEPKTANIKARLLALRELAEEQTIPLWVSAEPFLPGTDFDKYYREILIFSKDSLKEIVVGKMNYEAGVNRKFNWEEVVKITERYRQNNLGKIRFHYKQEFWDFLRRKQFAPVDLKLAPREQFCYRNPKEDLQTYLNRLPKE